MKKGKKWKSVLATAVISGLMTASSASAANLVGVALMGGSTGTIGAIQGLL